MTLLSVILVFSLAACGGGDGEDAEPEATTPPQPTATSEAPAPADTPMPTLEILPNPDDDALATYAAEHAGGPGAIFLGDPTQLIGLPPHPGLMFQASEAQYLQALTASILGFPAMGISSHMFIYTSDYYQGLIEKARLTNPTPLTSS